MSKAALDSDLYGDIYGEDDNEYIIPLHDENDEEADEQALSPQEGTLSGDASVTTETGSGASPKPKPTESSLKPTATSAAAEKNNTTTPSSSQADNSLPAKPVSPTITNGSSSSSGLSYSAQIAQQFSAYQQTPSQERQQRPGMSKIATHESSPSDSVFGKKPSEMHDAGKMFIGGLNWDTTDEGLRDYFSQFGKVDACTIMRDANGTSRGFAFLTFEDPNAVSLVVGREHFLDGKQIDPKRAIPREEHLRNTRYFVGGLAPTTTAESMKEFFSTYGKVVDATVMVDRESGRSKGFGFVTFEDANNADQLVGKIGLVLDEKQIEVKMAQPRSQRDQARSTNQIVGQNTAGMFNDTAQVARNTPMNIPFTPQQPNPMTMMMQRSAMNQMPMMSPAMPMMNMNPMAMAAMGMGMGGMNGMNGMMGGGMNGMNGMGMMGNGVGMAGMGGMNGMGGMGAMGNMGPMRLGMGPMGAMGMGAGAMGGMGAMGGNMAMGMGMRAGMGGAMGGGGAMGRMGMNTGGPGPARITSRGQHNFHPYAR
ncbi:hypothetical protein AMATHDRAFT_70802 [Amanita thiersii Skay4041]|uniref:RRM domain-containing protein n=1 Tax=Amanita thiersii Skay4041 TaxID=703135 RepID=A0A2A9N8A0_9AGAR|nr:hypothetical protein AMATHDRAFT_70802 [Amanita thiersii Skay4041]